MQLQSWSSPLPVSRECAIRRHGRGPGCRAAVVRHLTCRRRRQRDNSAPRTFRPRAADRRTYPVIASGGCHHIASGLRSEGRSAVTSMEIRLLGPVEVRNGADRQAPPGRGDRALLALLALSPGQVVATTTLIDALWEPEGLPDDPGNALQLRVSKLRRALALLGAADVLGRDGAGYRLDIEP